MPTAAPHLSSVAQDRSRVGTKYRTYKRATNRLAAWLAHTVKDLQTSASIGSYQGPTRQGIITIAQFSEYTDLILNAVPSIDIPLEIVDNAEKAFLLRQEKADLLQADGYESDDGHQHVIAVLGDIQAKLRRRYQASRLHQRAIPIRNEREALEPSFQLLDIDPLEGATVEEANGGTTAPLHPPTPKISKNKKAKLQKKKKKKQQQTRDATEEDCSLEESDPFFVLMCLLSDLKSMREYIKDLWQEYKDGKLDLITASLTTNATFDIIRTYEDDFPAISTLLSDYSKTMKLILSRKFGHSDEGLECFLHPCTDPTELKVEEIETVGRSLSRIPKWADLVFANAFYFLNGPRHCLLKKKGDKMRPNENVKDPFANFKAPQDKQLNVIQRLQRDVQILAYFARMIYRGYDFDQVTHDHFTMQWKLEFAKPDGMTITLAHAFGAQLYLDIYHVLKQDMKRGFGELVTSSIIVKESIRLWNYSIKDADVAFELWEISSNIKIVENTMQAVEQIQVENTKWREAVQATRPLRGDRETDKLLASLTPLEMNPLLCGIMLFQSIHQLRDAGVYLARYFDSIKRAGQFYWGCQAQRDHYKNAESVSHHEVIPEFESPLHWDDMEYMFDMHGAVTFFDGNLPQSNNDMVDLIDLDYAFESEDRATCQGQRLGPIHTVPKKEKVEFAKSIYSYEPIAVHHRLHFSKYLKATIEIEEGTVYDWTLETLQALLETHASLKPKDGDVSQLTILRSLKEALQRESRALRFDYLMFHCRCLNLLRVMIARLLLTHGREPYMTGTDWLNDRNLKFISSATLYKAYTDLPDGEVLRMYTFPKGSSQTPYCRKKCRHCNVSFWTTKRLVAIDTSIKLYLDGDNGGKDEHIKKIDSVWGVPPA